MTRTATLATRHDSVRTPILDPRLWLAAWAERRRMRRLSQTALRDMGLTRANVSATRLSDIAARIADGR